MLKNVHGIFLDPEQRKLFVFKFLLGHIKEWCDYYHSKERTRLLNVISLEFSHTLLDKHVQSPRIVRQLDWVETAWPQFLRDSHTDATNKLVTMKYPKVREKLLSIL